MGIDKRLNVMLQYIIDICEVNMRKKLKTIGIYTLLFIIILLMLGGVANILMTAWAGQYTVTHENISDLPKDFAPDCILVLGAKVIDDNTMSAILTDRVSVGLDVYEYYDGTVPLLLSGGSEPGENEVNAMAVYAVSEGVGDDFILTDGEGVNTYASISRAKEIFNAEKIVIVTQDFHMARSIYIARSLGMEAYGVTADLRKYFAKNYIREYFARLKDLTFVITGVHG